MLRPLSGNCSMRVRSTTVATVGLVVVMSGVTSPATVTAVAVVPNFSTGSTTADWPASRLSAPFHASILADSTEQPYLGKAFGFHRAMDTLGAAIGPLLTFAILALSQNDLRQVFLYHAFPVAEFLIAEKNRGAFLDVLRRMP